MEPGKVDCGDLRFENRVSEEQRELREDLSTAQTAFRRCPSCGGVESVRPGQRSKAALHLRCPLCGLRWEVSNLADSRRVMRKHFEAEHGLTPLAHGEADGGGSQPSEKVGQPEAEL